MRGHTKFLGGFEKNREGKAFMEPFTEDSKAVNTSIVSISHERSILVIIATKWRPNHNWKAYTWVTRCNLLVCPLYSC